MLNRRARKWTFLFHIALIVLLMIETSANAFSSADNCEFLRKIINSTNQMEMTIPAGIYTCNSPIVINRSGFKLIGAGKVVLRLADHANCPLLIMGNIETPPKPVSEIEVSHLILDGNRENQDSECWGGDCDKGGVSFVRNNCITVRGASDSYIHDVELYRARSGGIVTEKKVFRLHVDGLKSEDNYFDGLACYETYQSVFENMDLSRNYKGAGISLDIRFHGNIIRKTKLDSNKDVGIFMRDAHGNLFEDVEILNSGNHGAFIAEVEEQGPESAPQNNIFKRLTVKGSRGNGFHLNNVSAVHNKLIQPIFAGNKGVDIFEPIKGLVEIENAPQVQSLYSKCSELLRSTAKSAYETVNSHAFMQ